MDIKQDKHCMFSIRSADNGLFVGGKKTGQIGYEPEFFSVFPTLKGALKFIEKQVSDTFEVKKTPSPKKKKTKAKTK